MLLDSRLTGCCRRGLSWKIVIEVQPGLNFTKFVNVGALKDAKRNVDVGAWRLSQLLPRFNSSAASMILDPEV